jgi:hypothetical protein
MTKMKEYRENPPKGLFNISPIWEKQWKGMPEFHHEDLTPYRSVQIHFRNIQDMQEFSKLINQKITEKTKFLWFPKDNLKRIDSLNQQYISKEQVNTRYPIYIISKGRWELRLTSKSLEKMNIPYHIVVEPQEYDNYAAVIDPKKILTLPFSNLGQGSIPARNWVWEHSIGQGAKRHWILDDNIRGFYRYHDNKKILTNTPGIFCAAEDFADRYLNLALCGFQYRFFVPAKEGKRHPFVLNTRIYSCILIQNDLSYRWRGRYNEDTDLSLRILKDGLCTVLFNAFLANKQATMTMKGGNTDYLYQGDGRLKMAQSLQEQHPDVVKIVQRWGRWQHLVDYRKFRHNKLIPNPDAVISQEKDEYFMELE